MRKFLLILFPLALLAAACSPEQHFVGKWQGKMQMGNSLKSSPMGAMAGGFANLIQPQLDLRPDKTFTLSMSMAPIDGTWRLDHDEIILTPKTVMGMSADDAQKQAQKELDHAKADSSFPFPLPSNLPGTSEMRVHVNDKDQTLSLDPGSGTMFAGFGNITFTKV